MDIFPITEIEAEILHASGWSSGFGWKFEPDWWLTDTPADLQMESRDWPSTYAALKATVLFIRERRQMLEARFKIVAIDMCFEETKVFAKVWRKAHKEDMR